MLGATIACLTGVWRSDRHAILATASASPKGVAYRNGGACTLWACNSCCIIVDGLFALGKPIAAFKGHSVGNPYDSGMINCP